MIKPISLLLCLAGIALTSEAEAQHFVMSGHSRRPVATSTGTTSRAAATSPAPYSYYTLSSRPARSYVGYGGDDFPFLGTPYGHPYDPWTWPMMSGQYSNSLGRYYQPPLK